MAKKKKKEKVVKDTSERWLLTYADMMNLLLILFIILYASSNLDQAKADAIALSMNNGFAGVISIGDSRGRGSGSEDTEDTEEVISDILCLTEPGQAAAPLYWDDEAMAFSQFYGKLKAYAEENGISDQVDIAIDDGGIVISFRENALFESGLAVLDTDSTALIEKLGGLLKDLNYTFILVEGHTDSVPISTAKYQDNMELSTQRAANVWRVLVDCGLSPKKMASIGYGEYRPVASNDTVEGRAQNRRVTVSILKNDMSSDEYITYGDL